MSDVQRNLMPGEQVLFATHLHQIVYGWPAIVLLVGLFFLGGGSAGFGLLLVLAALGLAALTWSRVATTEFVVTNRRVIGKSGFISRSTHETSLTKLEALGVSQGILGRFLNFGTITVTGIGGTPQTFPQISSPLRVREVVYSQIDTAPAGAAPAPAAAQTFDIVTQLDRLAGLRQQGVLTDEEFEAQKRRLLAGT